MRPARGGTQGISHAVNNIETVKEPCACGAGVGGCGAGGSPLHIEIDDAFKARNSLITHIDGSSSE